MKEFYLYIRLRKKKRKKRYKETNTLLLLYWRMDVTRKRRFYPARGNNSFTLFHLSFETPTTYNNTNRTRVFSITEKGHYRAILIQTIRVYRLTCPPEQLCTIYWNELHADAAYIRKSQYLKLVLYKNSWTALLTRGHTIYEVKFLEINLSAW